MSEVFTGTVRDLSHKGLGVVDHPDGRTFFVRGTWPGDKGEFEIPNDALKYEEATLVNLISPSPERVTVACDFRGLGPGRCGGCPWMIANYSSQIQFKLKRLLHALERRGIKTEKFIISPMIPAPHKFGYRNRVQIKSDGKRVGYVSEGSSIFAPVSKCLIMNEKLSSLFQEIQNTLPREDFTPTGHHQWTYVDLDDELHLNDVVVNRRRPFRQGNSDQNQEMKKWLRKKLEKIPTHYPIIDLFAGSGNFTEIIQEIEFTNILAVEVQGSALEQLRAKDLLNVRILELDMNSKGAWAKIARLQPHAKVMVVDPPREGLEKRKGLFKYLDNLECLIYISCEIDSFSRDAADILAHGWQMIELTPIDLFPHTPHIEILSVFQRL
jgi:23S rRNA (uracil1939-C5)-methyltransferase